MLAVQFMVYLIGQLLFAVVIPVYHCSVLTAAMSFEKWIYEHLNESYYCFNLCETDICFKSDISDFIVAL